MAVCGESVCIDRRMYDCPLTGASLGMCVECILYAAATWLKCVSMHQQTQHMSAKSKLQQPPPPSDQNPHLAQNKTMMQLQLMLADQHQQAAASTASSSTNTVSRFSGFMTSFLVVWPFWGVALAPGALIAMPFLPCEFILLCCCCSCSPVWCRQVDRGVFSSTDCLCPAVECFVDGVCVLSQAAACRKLMCIISLA